MAKAKDFQFVKRQAAGPIKLLAYLIRYPQKAQSGSRKPRNNSQFWISRIFGMDEAKHTKFGSKIDHVINANVHVTDYVSGCVRGHG